MTQLPTGAEGAAAGVLIYSFICLTGSLLMIWLTWRHREKTSYVGCLAYFTTLSTVCSIAQQIHDIAHWRTIVTKMFNHVMANPDNAELAISNGSVGLDRILYYIQLYCYHVESLFFMLWSWAVVQSIYTLDRKPNLQRPFKILAIFGKAFSILFPALIVSLLQVDQIQKNETAFFALAGQSLYLSLALGGIAMLLVAVRYIQLQRKFKHVSIIPMQQTPGRGNLLPQSYSRHTQNAGKSNMYDRWLLTRFTILFVFQGIFEIAIVLFTMNSRNALKEVALRSSPDLSAEKAQKSFPQFMPGVTPSLLLFICFGTTKPCLRSIRALFFWKSNRDMRLVISSPVLLSPQPSDLNQDDTVLRPQESYHAALGASARIDEVGRPEAPKREVTVELQTMKPLPSPPSRHDADRRTKP